MVILIGERHYFRHFLNKRVTQPEFELKNQRRKPDADGQLFMILTNHSEKVPKLKL